MGRFYWDAKAKVEDCISVDIPFLRRHNYFCGYRPCGIEWKNCYGKKTDSIGINVSTTDGNNYARFHYTTTIRHSGEKIDYDYKVGLTTTPCYFGGVRYWFLCPSCSKRVGTLYLAPGGGCFKCRHCNNLTYESRNEPRRGLVGVMVFQIKMENKIDKRFATTKRWTYRGRPTKKARKLNALMGKFEHLTHIYAEDVLSK